jgi:HK97 family phage major capsid protein
MFDFSELNAEQLEARKAELLAELETPETRDALSTEDLESRMAEVIAIDAEIENRKQAAAAEEREAETVAQMSGEKIIVEEKKMDYAVNTPEYRSLWLRNLQGNLTEEEKRDYSASSSNAVPTLVADKFFEKMKKLAPMLSEITLLRVAGNIKFVAEGSRAGATAKHVENSAMAAAEDTTVSVSLTGYEFMKVIKISRTAKLMAIDAFENWIVEMLAGDIARAIDNYILNDATNGVAALTFTTGTNQILATAGYSYGDVCDLIALLPAAYDAEAKFLANKKTLYGVIAQIVDSVGNPIFVPDTVTGIGGRLMGFPVVVDDYVSSEDDALYLGKWSDVVGNLPEDIHVDADESAGFTANSIVYRGIAVFDSKPAKGDAIVRLVSTVGA